MPRLPSPAHAALCLGLLLAPLLSCKGKGGPIEIALVLPLEYPGVAPMVRGAELAVEEINAAGGIGGRRLMLTNHDDFGDPDSAVRVASIIVASSAVAVIGSAYSGTTIAAAAIFNGADPIVQLSPSASSPAVTEAGNWTFRVCASDLAYGAALARWAYDTLHLERAAILYVNDEYGRGVRRTFSNEFSRLGGGVVESDPFLAEQPVVGPYLQRIRQEHDAQVLIVAANQAEGLPVLREIRKSGLGLPVLGSDGLVGIEAEGAVAEGLYVSTGYLVDSDTPANRSFVAAYTRRYPTVGLPDQGAAASYDAVRLLAVVFERVGDDRTLVRAALAQVGLSTPGFGGAAGEVAFDEHGDVPRHPVQIGIVRGGRLVPP